MSLELMQRLTATAAAMRNSDPGSVRVKNLAQQLDAAAAAICLYSQITGIADVLAPAIGPGIDWQDVSGRSIAVFGEHSRGYCDAGMFRIKLRDCAPFLNTYQLFLNGKFISSNMSFMGAKDAALKHFERLQKIQRAAVCADKAQLATFSLPQNGGRDVQG